MSERDATAPAEIDALSLLGEAGAIILRLSETRYRLSLTKANKLLLTKVADEPGIE
jgi:hemin uptake protein HemP